MLACRVALSYMLMFKITFVQIKDCDHAAEEELE